MRVLLTGAAGSIGSVLLTGLCDHGHEVVGLDRVPRPEGTTGEWWAVDCADADAVAEAVEASRPDAVVHLAGHPGEQALPDALTSHVVTTAAVLDAAVEHRVARVVHASSNHAVGRTPRTDLVGGPLPDGVLGVDAPPRPDTFYGVGKVAAEALLRLYADRHDLDVVACRIGSFLERPQTVRHLSTWLSHDDCVRMVQAALTAPSPGFSVLYGVSANARGWWDLEPGRRLGFDPQDDAEAFAADVAPRPEDAAEGALVGGPFALEEFHRPALDRRA